MHPSDAPRFFLSLPHPRPSALERALGSPLEYAEACLPHEDPKHVAAVLTRVLHVLGAEEEKTFFAKTLPHVQEVWRREKTEHALFGPERRVPLLVGAERVELSRAQVAALVGLMWLGGFDQRTPLPYPPGIRWNGFAVGPLFHFPMVAPLAAVAHYLNRVATASTVLRTPVVLRRFVLEPAYALDLTKPLCRVLVSSDTPIERTPHELHADFANKFPGGGTLTGGCVQEEILFVVKPECLVSMLLVAELAPNEAFAIEGAEEISRYRGYGRAWEWAGSHQETRAQPAAIIGIDAVVARGQEHQWDSFMRDVRKCIAGVRAYGPGVTFATGNWGCGAFGGDKHVKVVQQILACSAVGQTLCYSTFGERELQTAIERLVERFGQSTIGQVLEVIDAVQADFVPRGTLLDKMVEHKR